MVHVIPEIVEQGLGRGENVWHFVLANVLVIAFALLIVVAQHAATIHHEGEPILEAVLATCNQRGQAPHHHFHECVFGDNVALFAHQFSIHVGDNTNTPECGQTLQQTLFGLASPPSLTPSA